MPSRWIFTAALLTIATSAMVLAGWALNVGLSGPLFSFWIAMKANTAIAFLAAGLALILDRDEARWRRRAGAGLAIGCALIGAATLVEYAGIDLGIDELVFGDSAVSSPAWSHGRMAVNTAFSFVLLGVALLARNSPGRWHRRVAEVSAAAIAVVTMFALVGYVYAFPALSGRTVTTTPMALHTAALFLVLALALILAVADGWIGKALLGQGPGSLLARRLIPIGMVTLLLVGGVALRAERVGALPAGAEVPIVVSVGSLLLIVAILINAGSINRLDADRRQSEDALRESERLHATEEQRRILETALSAAANSVVITDSAGEITWVNPAFSKMTGYMAQEAIGRNPRDLIKSGQHDAAFYRNMWDTILAGNVWQGELVNRRKDASVYTEEQTITPVTDENGRITHFIAIKLDVTDRKRAESALRASEARFERLAESGILGILIADVNGHLLESNDAYLSMVGYSREELVHGAIRWADLTPPEFKDRTDKALAQLAGHGVAAPFEMETLRKDGGRLPILVGVAMLEFPKCIAFCVDLSGRKAAEAALARSEDQLRHAQKMEAVGRLAGGVAHDFNNLLSVVLGYGETLLDDLRPGDPNRESVEEICKAGNRAAALTRQLLMFSRRQVLDPKVLDLNEVLNGMDTMLRHILGEDIELTTLPFPSLDRVLIDPSSLEQVIMNLVVNARDAMPTGGRLTIETASVELGEDYQRMHLQARVGAHVMLAVSDTGVGMTPETQARIFEPFFTTKEEGKGTGLGLSTVFGIVEQSGGHVWVYSEQGQGTTFKIYFPCYSSDEAVDRLHVSDTLPGGAETILLVEDEEQVRAVATSILRRQGYDVLVVANGGEAVLVCEAHPGTIDMLLTDVVMPRMSGPELAGRLAPLRPEMKILYMSGYTDDSIVRHGVLAGNVAFVQKPLTAASLGRKVREVLDS